MRLKVKSVALKVMNKNKSKNMDTITFLALLCIIEPISDAHLVNFT